jgi:hypothetical protein
MTHFSAESYRTLPLLQLMIDQSFLVESTIGKFKLLRENTIDLDN